MNIIISSSSLRLGEKHRMTTPRPVGYVAHAMEGLVTQNTGLTAHQYNVAFRGLPSLVRAANQDRHFTAASSRPGQGQGRVEPSGRGSGCLTL